MRSSNSMAAAETSPPPHFFRVILPQTLEDKKLSLPEKFVRRFGHELSMVATLRVANGGVWQVGLTKDGRKMWFSGGGWHEFLMCHSVCAGYFLVFRYEKKSNFHVLIFNMSACEIAYPSKGEKAENGKQKPAQQEKSEDSVEIVSVRTPNPPVSSQQNGSTRGIKRPRACVVASSNSPKFKHGYVYESRGKKCKVEELVEIHESKAVKESSRGKMCNSRRHLTISAETKLEKTAQCGEDGNETEVAADHKLLVSLQDMGIYVARNFGFISETERERTIKIAGLFKSKNPSFMAIMRQRTVHRRSLYVPAKFTDKYFSRDSTYMIKLEDCDGKEWPIQIKGRSSGGSDLMKGWNAFTKEKKLEIGDIIVFELIREEDILFKVSVFRSTVVV